MRELPTSIKYETLLCSCVAVITAVFYHFKCYFRLSHCILPIPLSLLFKIGIALLTDPVNPHILSPLEKFNSGTLSRVSDSRAIVTEWFTGLCLPQRQLWVQAPKIHQCLQTHLQVCGSKRLSCHIDLRVSRCGTIGESENHTGKKAYRASTLALKSETDGIRSPKQGYQWNHEKDLYSQH